MLGEVWSRSRSHPSHGVDRLRTTRIYLVGTSSVDARHQRCGFTSLLRPAIPRHPASPVGLLASAPDLVPGHEALSASLRKRFATTWISWGRGIDVNR